MDGLDPFVEGNFTQSGYESPNSDADSESSTSEGGSVASNDEVASQTSSDSEASGAPTGDGTKKLFKYLFTCCKDSNYPALKAVMPELVRMTKSFGSSNLMNQPNLKDRYRRTPLLMAVEGGNLELVSLMLRNGADPKRETIAPDSSNAMNLAFRFGHTEIVDYLLDQGYFDIENAENHIQYTLLHHATYGTLSCVKLLLNRGAKVNATTAFQVTPLHTAVSAGNPMIVMELISRGADANARDKFGRTPLYLACNSGFALPIVKILVEEGRSDVNITDNNNIAPFDIADKKNLRETCRYLLQHGAVPNSIKENAFGLGTLRFFRPYIDASHPIYGPSSPYAMPTARTKAGICSVGSKIFLHGGSGLNSVQATPDEANFNHPDLLFDLFVLDLKERKMQNMVSNHDLNAMIAWCMDPHPNPDAANLSQQSGQSQSSLHPDGIGSRTSSHGLVGTVAAVPGENLVTSQHPFYWNQQSTSLIGGTVSPAVSRRPSFTSLSQPPPIFPESATPVEGSPRTSIVASELTMVEQQETNIPKEETNHPPVVQDHIPSTPSELKSSSNVHVPINLSSSWAKSPATPIIPSTPLNTIQHNAQGQPIIGPTAVVMSRIQRSDRIKVSKDGLIVQSMPVGYKPGMKKKLKKEAGVSGTTVTSGSATNPAQTAIAQGYLTEANFVACIKGTEPFCRATTALAYWEMQLQEATEKIVTIGFTHDDFPLDRYHPGWCLDSYAYHNDDGSCFHVKSAIPDNGQQWGPRFSTGDIVGAGINFNTNEVFFTKNGKFLGIAYRGVSSDYFFPTISFGSVGAKVKVNIGRKPFKFSFAVPTLTWTRLGQTRFSPIAFFPHPAGNGKFIQISYGDRQGSRLSRGSTRLRQPIVSIIDTSDATIHASNTQYNANISSCATNHVYPSSTGTSTVAAVPTNYTPTSPASTPLAVSTSSIATPNGSLPTIPTVIVSSASSTLLRDSGNQPRSHPHQDPKTESQLGSLSTDSASNPPPPSPTVSVSNHPSREEQVDQLYSEIEDKFSPPSPKRGRRSPHQTRREKEDKRVGHNRKLNSSSSLSLKDILPAPENLLTESVVATAYIRSSSYASFKKRSKASSRPGKSAHLSISVPITDSSALDTSTDGSDHKKSTPRDQTVADIVSPPPEPVFDDIAIGYDSQIDEDDYDSYMEIEDDLPPHPQSSSPAPPHVEPFRPRAKDDFDLGFRKHMLQATAGTGSSSALSPLIKHQHHAEASEAGVKHRKPCLLNVEDRKGRKPKKSNKSRSKSRPRKTGGPKRRLRKKDKRSRKHSKHGARSASNSYQFMLPDGDYQVRYDSKAAYLFCPGNEAEVRLFRLAFTAAEAELTPASPFDLEDKFYDVYEGVDNQAAEKRRKRREDIRRRFGVKRDMDVEISDENDEIPYSDSENDEDDAENDYLICGIDSLEVSSDEGASSASDYGSDYGSDSDSSGDSVDDSTRNSSSSKNQDPSVESSSSTPSKTQQRIFPLTLHSDLLYEPVSSSSPSDHPSGPPSHTHHHTPLPHAPLPQPTMYWSDLLEERPHLLRDLGSLHNPQSALIDNHLYFFTDSVMFKLNLSTMRHEKKKLTGTGPRGVNVASAVITKQSITQEGAHILCFGGVAGNIAQSNVYTLDVISGEWDVPHLSGVYPRPRDEQGSLVYVGDDKNTIVLQGGWNGKNFIDDLDFLHLEDPIAPDPLVHAINSVQLSDLKIVAAPSHIPTHSSDDGTKSEILANPSPQTLLVSKIILAYRSSFFHKLLTENPLMAVYNLPSETDFSLFSAFIKYLYTDAITPDLIDDTNASTFIAMFKQYAPSHTERVLEELVITRPAIKSTMNADLGLAFNEKMFSDVQFVIKNGTDEPIRMYGHAPILCTRSEYFGAMFMNPHFWEAQNREATIKNVPPAVFAELIRYLYTFDIVVENVQDTIVDLLQLSHRYGVKGLQSMTCEIISSNLTVENACSLLALADQLGLKKLTKNTANFIRTHLTKISTTDDYLAHSSLISKTLSSFFG